MTLEDFRNSTVVSIDDICREIFQEHRDSIKIKKEAVGVRNLSTIFQATLRLSNQKGFHAMSLRDLCRESGLSMGALYSYFSSKEELLEIIQEQGRRIATKILIDHIEQETTPRAKLRAAIRSHLYLSEVMQDWFFFSYMETRFFDRQEHKKAIASELFTEELIADILKLGVAQKVFAVENPTMTASFIKAILQDWYLKRWKYSRRNISVDDYARHLIDFVEQYVTAEPVKTEQEEL